MKKKRKPNAAKKNVNEKYVHSMKVVTSHTCSICKTQCARGIGYLEKMQSPGAVGNGVPCHLTKGKGFR